MKFTINSSKQEILIIVLFVTMICVQVNHAADQSLILNIRGFQNVYVQGEPIELLLVFENRSQSKKEVDVGPIGMEHYKVVINGNNRRLEKKGPMEYGVAFPNMVTIEQNEIAYHVMVLDDIVRIDKPGRYMITLEKDGVTTKSNPFEVTVISNQDTKMNSLVMWYDELWDMLNDVNSGRALKSHALKLISLSRSGAAVEQQKNVISDINMHGGDGRILRETIISMVCSQQPEGIAFMVDNILGNKDATEYQKRMVIMALKAADAHTWDMTKYPMLKSYTEIIQASRPMPQMQRSQMGSSPDMSVREGSSN